MKAKPNSPQPSRPSVAPKVTWPALAVLAFFVGIFGGLAHLPSTGISKNLAKVESLELSSREPAMFRVSPQLRASLEQARRDARVESEFASKPALPLKLSDFSQAHSFNRGQLTRIDPAPEKIDPNSDESDYLPEHLNASDDFSRTMSKIADHNLQSYFRGDAFRHSEFGRITKKIEHSLSAGLSWGGSKSRTTSDSATQPTPSTHSLGPISKVADGSSKPESRTSHHVQVGLLAAQAQAKMTYSGLTDAELSYSIGRQQLEWALREPLRENLKLVYNHVENRIERRDSLSLHLSW